MNSKLSIALSKNFIPSYPKEGKKIAAHGQKTVLKNHLYRNRAQTLLSIINKTRPNKAKHNQIKTALGKSLFMSNIKTGKKLEPYAQKPLLAKITPDKLHKPIVAVIKQIETIQFKWTIPYWYILLTWQKLNKLR